MIGPIHTYACVLVIAVSLLFVITAKRGELHLLLRKDAQKDLLLTSIFNMLMFSLIFTSLRFTTAGNVAVLMFLQILFSYLYFNVLGKERLSRLHSAGAVIMGIGALVILIPDDMQFNLGDILVLAGAAVAPFVNLYQKRSRLIVGSIVILTYRNLVAIPVLLLIAWLFEPRVTGERFLDALPILLAIGIVVFVLGKILWVEALHRLSITKMSAMTALIPIFTLCFAYIILGEVPGMRQTAGIIPVLLGGYMITRPDSP